MICNAMAASPRSPTAAATPLGALALECPTFLRQTFVEWAALTIPRSFWAAAYYRQQRGAGKTHQAALRALAYKWIRIVHHCWLDTFRR